MGRDALITYQEVAAAAEGIKAAGDKPSSRLVRERLGNIGSMGTITKHLQTWRDGQERRITTVTLPVTVQRSLLDFMDLELSNAKATLELEVAERQQEATDLAIENERMIGYLCEKDEMVATLQAELASLQGRNAQITMDLLAAKEEAGKEREASERARTELAKASLRLEAIPRLDAELADLRTKLEKDREEYELVRTELASVRPETPVF
jgi:colicin import membrane protein